MNEDGYASPYFLSEDAKRLLIVAGLPLLDGYFLTFLVGSMWTDFWRCIAFGVTAFSGAASFLTAMNLKGSLLRRIFEVCFVYTVIGLSALAITTLHNTIIKLLPANISVFTALFLLGLGLEITGNRFLGKVAYSIGSRSVVGAILALIIYNGITQAMAKELYVDPSLDPARMWPVAYAVLSGFAFTLLGLLLGYKFQHVVDGAPMKWGAGVALLIMSLTVLGFEIPSFLIIPPIIVGVVITLAKKNNRKQPVAQITGSVIESMSTD